MGIKSFIGGIGNRAGNSVARLSSLSSAQVEEIQKQRESYLMEEPDPQDVNAKQLTEKLMAASSIEVFNAYLTQLKSLYLPVDKDAEYNRPFDKIHNIRYINITKWVIDNKENSIEKLVNVYAVLSNENCNIALVFNRTQKTGTKVYLAVVNNKNDDNNVDADIYKSRLVEAIKGNFPGAELNSDSTCNGIIPCMDNDKSYSVATTSNIPTEKSEKFISQTIEKLLDGIVPDSKKTEYTIVFLATPIRDVEERKLRLGEFYSGLAPYSQWQTDYHFNDTKMYGSSATAGVNVGASAGIQNGTNYAVTDNAGETTSSAISDTRSSSKTITDGISNTTSSSNSYSVSNSESSTVSDMLNGGSSLSSTNAKNFSNATSVGADTSVGGKVTPLGFGVDARVGANISNSTSVGGSISEGMTQSSGWSKGIANAVGKTTTDTVVEGLSNTVSNSVAKTTGNAIATTLGRAVINTVATTAGVASGVNFGANFGTNFARSSTVTALVGKTEGITQSYINFNIKHALELIESQMKRLEQGTALGMWDFAAYVLSEDANTANNVAHAYLSLTVGNESYMSKSAINLWRGNVDEEKNAARSICSYIRELRHPIFCLNPSVTESDMDFNVYPALVTATTNLSGRELAYSLNFPRKSISGFPVLSCAEFGRNVVTYDLNTVDSRNIELGKVFHMNHVEKDEVKLSTESLKSHTFISGSTGSGKSNTIYRILDEIKNKGTKFLVIEPTKGEYKSVFGNDEAVYVYGTNPALTSLLRLNPFSFSNGTHVLEHMDRLVEIFNVCWPMYAAMPSVMKSAIEKSYIDCGWDLITSQNRYDDCIFPTFVDVARNIKSIIENSEYDADNKGAYKGALLMRLQSLTTGINGLIFSSNDISAEDLFEKNVIVDLSRVGASETKSLIMGVLILKLQEYLMSGDIPINAELRHVTVLEEAHNILRRTSIEQPTESSNILGKSVEMIANSIAEMRTYGEGFIIADQAPGLMDMSVIRNTNTKIIMRLPDYGDRELVGKAANLDENQIDELSKIPCGVAAVYQNEWVQPILCKVEKYDGSFDKFEFNSGENDGFLNYDAEISNLLLRYIMDKELSGKGDKKDLRELKDMVVRSGLESHIKVDFLDYLYAEKENGLDRLRCLVFDFFRADAAIRESIECDNIKEWVESVIDKLEPSVKGYTKKQIDLALALILYEKASIDVEYQNIFIRYTEIYKAGGGLY